MLLKNLNLLHLKLFLQFFIPNNPFLIYAPRVPAHVGAKQTNGDWFLSIFIKLNYEISIAVIDKYAPAWDTLFFRIQHTALSTIAPHHCLDHSAWLFHGSADLQMLSSILMNEVKMPVGSYLKFFCVLFA